MNQLSKRLRERAKGEREIQKNNEAVANALAPQLEAFERRDGTHNAFAVRLMLDHRNCAKKDAALAADWDEAADLIDTQDRKMEELVKALEPFAEAADGIDDTSHPDWEMWEHPAAMNVYVRDFRLARITLSTIQAAKDGK